MGPSSPRYGHLYVSSISPIFQVRLGSGLDNTKFFFRRFSHFPSKKTHLPSVDINEKTENV